MAPPVAQAALTPHASRAKSARALDELSPRRCSERARGELHDSPDLLSVRTTASPEHLSAGKIPFRGFDHTSAGVILPRHD